MKKIFLLLAVSAMSLMSCEDEEKQYYNSADGSLAYYTDGTSGAFYIQDVPNPEFLVEVGVTTTSPADRTINVSIDPASTATADQYTLVSSSLVIPANSNVGYIKVVGNYANASTEGTQLILKLDGVNEAELASFDTTYTLDIYQFCPFVVDDFLGLWVADEVDYQAYPSTFTLGANTELNEIIMSGIWDVNPASQTRVYFNDTDPSNFKLDFPPYLENMLVSSYGTYGPAYIDRGAGTFSACAQTISMTFQVRVAAGFFAPTTINFYRP